MRDMFWSWELHERDGKVSFWSAGISQKDSSLLIYPSLISLFEIFSSPALERDKLLASRFSRLFFIGGVFGTIPSLLSDEKPSLSLMLMH